MSSPKGRKTNARLPAKDTTFSRLICNGDDSIAGFRSDDSTYPLLLRPFPLPLLFDHPLDTSMLLELRFLRSLALGTLCPVLRLLGLSLRGQLLFLPLNKLCSALLTIPGVRKPPVAGIDREDLLRKDYVQSRCSDRFSICNGQTTYRYFWSFGARRRDLIRRWMQCRRRLWCLFGCITGHRYCSVRRDR